MTFHWRYCILYTCKYSCIIYYTFIRVYTNCSYSLEAEKLFAFCPTVSHDRTLSLAAYNISTTYPPRTKIPSKKFRGTFTTLWSTRVVMRLHCTVPETGAVPLSTTKKNTQCIYKYNNMRKKKKQRTSKEEGFGWKHTHTQIHIYVTVYI